MGPRPKIRVAVAEDHHLVRAGVVALLEKALDVELVGEAADGEEALALVRALAPDVLLIDIGLPRLSGIEVVAQSRKLGLPTRAVILSMLDDETTVRGALRAGAVGYLHKASVAEELLLAIRAAFKRQPYLSPCISQTILSDLVPGPAVAEPPALPRTVTHREREVLQLIAAGLSNGAIAQKLTISEKTVEKHRSNMMRKLDAHDVVQLLQKARLLRLISP